MPNAVAARHQRIARPQFGDEMQVDGRVIISTEAAHQNIRLGMHGSFLFRDFTAVHQSLHVGVIHRPLHKAVAVVVVNPRVTRMGPMTIPIGVDQKSSQGAVGLFFCRYGRQFNNNMRFLHYLRQG